MEFGLLNLHSCWSELFLVRLRKWVHYFHDLWSMMTMLLNFPMLTYCNFVLSPVCDGPSERGDSGRCQRCTRTVHGLCSLSGTSAQMLVWEILVVSSFHMLTLSVWIKCSKFSRQENSYLQQQLRWAQTKQMRICLLHRYAMAQSHSISKKWCKEIFWSVVDI